MNNKFYFIPDDNFTCIGRENTSSVTVKHGVCQDLDHKRSIHNNLPDLLTDTAEQECKNLPEEVTSVCTVSYIPQVNKTAHFYVSTDPFDFFILPESAPKNKTKY